MNKKIDWGSIIAIALITIAGFVFLCVRGAINARRVERACQELGYEVGTFSPFGYEMCERTDGAVTTIAPLWYAQQQAEEEQTGK